MFLGHCSHIVRKQEIKVMIQHKIQMTSYTIDTKREDEQVPVQA